MGWVDLAQDRKRRRTLVSVLVILPILQNVGEFLTS